MQEQHGRNPFAPARLWRIAFIAYATALTLGTHWPQFELPASVPATDKTVHFVAFAGLTFLLWRTRWLRSRWTVAVVAIAWAALDEVTQHFVNRYVTWMDLLANGLGALSVVAWLWAMRPVGGTVNRRRLDLETFAFDRLFASSRPWIIAAATFLACGAPVAVVWFLLDPTAVARMILMAILAWLGATALVLLRALRSSRMTTVRERSCFRCAGSCRAVELEDGRGRCPGCGADVHFAQWLTPSPPPGSARVRLALAPAAAGTFLIVLAFAALLTVSHLYGPLIQSGRATSASALRIARTLGSVPESLATTANLAACLMFFAVAMRFYRRGLARYYDGAVRCRACGHDLRGTPTSDGRGRCGECGTKFTT